MRKIFYITISFLCLTYNINAQKKFNINEYRAEENFRKGIFYYNDTKYLSAVEFFIKALKYNPDFYRAKTWLGKSYYRAGYIENAVNEWQEVVENGGAGNIVINRLNNIFYHIGYSKNLPFIDSYIHHKTIDGNRWDSKKFSQPISLWFNSDNEIFITGLASKTIHQFDPNFNLIDKFTSGKKSFKMPFGFVVDSHDNMIVSDVKKDIVQKINKKGKGIKLIGGSGVKNGEFIGPEGLYIDKRDNIYVADTGNCRIQKFSSKGEFLMKFGRRGKDPGEFYRPTCIAMDDNDNIYVSDHKNKNIQKFDSDGNFIKYVFEEKKFKDIRNIHFNKNYFLISDGIYGGYIYNYLNNTWTHFKNFNFNRSKILSVSDMRLHNDNLYIADYYKNTVEVFVPKSYKYSNLGVEIEVVDTSEYPRVVLYCNVRNKNGKPAIGLEKKNFTVKELGTRIFPYDLVTSIYNKNKIKTIFLIEKSHTMKKYEEDIKEASGYFLKNILKTKDEVKVYNFHKNNWVGLKYSFQKLKIFEAVAEDDYHYIKDVSKPLYKSITEMMNKLSRKVIIFFTTGDYDLDKNFKSYDFDICMNYAKINHVPVYIINFTRNNELELKKFARETGGKYYYYFKDTKKLKRIRDNIVKTPINKYVIVYNTLKNKKLEDTWREVNLEVKFNKLSGVDSTGYFVPGH